MKILKYMAFALTGMLMASCGEDFDDWASPQSYPQEDAITIPGYSATAAEGAVIDMTKNPTTVKIVEFSGDELPEGFTLKNIRIAATPEGLEGAKETEIDLADDGTVDATVLSDLTVETFGPRPVQRVFNCKVFVDAVKDGQAVLIKAGTIQVKVTPKAPQISDNYYVIGEPSQWDPTCATLKFTHSDKDVYEDPIFTITIPVVDNDGDGDMWFAITDDITQQMNDWSYVFGCAEGNGKNSETGKISRRSSLSDDGSFKIAVADAELIRITLNMMDYSYKIEKLSALQYFYVVGTPNGWSADNAYKNMFYTQDATTYTYTTKWTGAWDLKVWDANSLGNWDNAWGTAVDGDGSASGSMINSGAQSFQSPEAGFYTLSINKKDMSYTWTRLDNQNPTEYTSVSLIGDFNGWGGDVDLEQVAAHNWFVEYTVPSNGGLKFRANHAWDTSWGTSDKETAIGDSYYLPIGGENINVPAGTYQFYLNDITGEWNIVKK